jgi:hypothetical protein
MYGTRKEYIDRYTLETIFNSFDWTGHLINHGAIIIKHAYAYNNGDSMSVSIVISNPNFGIKYYDGDCIKMI